MFLFITSFLLLIEDAKCIKLYGFFFFSYYFTTIEALPAFKIKKMIEKGLQYHESRTLCTLHAFSPFFKVGDSFTYVYVNFY